jgi:EmrB/QacA subfamily drug resistance transporter
MKTSHYKIFIALIYACVLFLDRLDLTIVNVTLPTVATYFHVTMTATDWISIVFLLALAISIPISSWLGDRFGQKKIYVIAMIIFGLGSTLCMFAPNLGALIFLRWLQGIGGGLLIPVGMTMLYRIYDKSEYASITSYTFLPSLVAPAIGPLIGGLILQAFSWRYVYSISGPIALVLALLAVFFIKPEQTVSKAKPFDWMGFLLCSIFLMDVFWILSWIGKEDLGIKFSMQCVFAVLILIAFIERENRFQYPLFNLTLFKQVSFVKANLLQLCFQACHFGAIFLVGLYLQIGIGFSPSMAGLIMGMQSFGAMATSRYSVTLFNHYGAQRPIIIGLLGIAILSPCILLIDSPTVSILALGLFFIRGIFSGLCGAPIQTLSVVDADREQLSQVNSIFNTGRQIAISLGVAISSILISVGLRLNDVHHNIINNYRQAVNVFGLGFLAITLIACLGVFLASDSLKLPALRKR